MAPPCSWCISLSSCSSLYLKANAFQQCCAYRFIMHREQLVGIHYHIVERSTDDPRSLCVGFTHRQLWCLSYALLATLQIQSFPQAHGAQCSARQKTVLYTSKHQIWRHSAHLCIYILSHIMNALGEQLKVFWLSGKVSWYTSCLSNSQNHVQTQMMYNFVQFFATSLLVLNFKTRGIRSQNCFVYTWACIKKALQCHQIYFPAYHSKIWNFYGVWSAQGLGS